MREPAATRPADSGQPRTGEHRRVWSSQLDAARNALQHADDVRCRRAGLHACAIVLGNCAATGRSWWGWTGWEWVRVVGAGSAQFRGAPAVADGDHRAPVETTVRPFLWRWATFSAASPSSSIWACSTGCTWSQLVRSQTREDGRSRLPGVLAQALLINRSSRLEDLSTEAFARLRAHPATTALHTGGHYALQQAVAADLGHCQPPVRPPTPA